MTKWNGEYIVKCPKCGCRKIWVFEHVDAISEHLIENGEWNHDYDNNEYGDILYSEFYCDGCGHSWRRKYVTIDSLLSKQKPIKKSVFREFIELSKEMKKQKNGQ